MEHLSPLVVVPFVVLLVCIAVLPLLAKEWWERSYAYVSLGLGIVTAAYCATILNIPERVVDSAREYFSFIALVGSLYVIASGIHIRMRGRSTPLRNVAFLFGGAIVANVIGTTGASMILIRPFLRVNKYRANPLHVVFFIFLVSNIGGALTPVGDPPLFLGYLQGVPFLWPLKNLWPVWAAGVAIVLSLFYVLDMRAYTRIPRSERERSEVVGERGELSGLQNLFFLAAILGAVFVTDPPFLREAIMIGAALGSYFTTHPDTHSKNDFNFGPLKEVSILFAGIFMTMVPALAWIEHNAAGFGLTQPGHFFWVAGALSSVLDNAPTYLNFFGVAQGVFAISPASTPMTTADLLAHHGAIVQAISIGAVFFGSMTYIGNGPNLMVKGIADQAGVESPTFLEYITRYSLPFLVPTFIILWLVFFF